MRRFIAGLGLVLTTACGDIPSEPTLSAAGSWEAVTPQGTISLSLTESTAGEITGTGSHGATALTVTGARIAPNVLDLYFRPPGTAVWDCDCYQSRADEITGWMYGGAFDRTSVVFRRP